LNLRELVEQSQSPKSLSIQSGKKLRESIMEDVQGMINALNQLESSDVLANIAEEDSESEPKDPVVLERELSDDVVGRLDDRFLSACESDVTALRVKKSEILVRNQELYQESRALASEMHLSPTHLVALVERSLKHHEQGLPGWWNKDLSHNVAFTLGSTGGPVGVTSDFTQHLAVMREALTRLSHGRRALSLALRGIVEHAQKTLLDIVGRELDASEAYASFHDALFRLPALSKELIYACISEMDALAIGVEAMTQSEIEALSVVWESVNTPSADRRGFWGQVEELSTRAKNNEDAFGEAVRLCSQESEEWVSDALEQAKKGHGILESRLFKLEMIHGEVEKLRSRQDTKSQILSLDSEVRILNAKLSDFEDLQCSKQRLTKRSGGTALLKEERFRRQMQGKFASKLEQLASLLRAWNSDEGEDFDASLLSEDVRMLLSNPGKMETWVEQRTKFMPLRTVQTKTPAQKRPVENPSIDSRPSARSSRHKSGISPPRARPPQSNSTRLKAPHPDLPTTKGAPRPFRHSQKRKPDEMQKVTVNSSKAPRTPTALSPSSRQVTKKGGTSTTKDYVAFLPFGHVLSDLSSPEAKENSSL
jgi:hypothetical protein